MINKKLILVLCLIFLIALVSCTKISDVVKGTGSKKDVPKNVVEVEDSFVVEDEQSNELKIVVK